MPLICKEILLQAGWPDEEGLNDVLAAAAEQEAKGIQDARYILKILRKRFPLPELPGLREKPVGCAEAISPESTEEEKNLQTARQSFQDLLRCPLVEKAALMPDACPAGRQPGDMPVGGVIAARNAIIPSAHSLDICCSLRATFYTTREPVPFQMDTLTKVTRFGRGGRDKSDWISHPITDEPVWDNVFLSGLQEYACKHLADQGDGNHFAFLGRCRVESSWLDLLTHRGHEKMAAAIRPFVNQWVSALVTHHGSRGLGAHVYKRGQIAARKHTNRVASNIPDNVAWLETDRPEGAAYWEALGYVQRWTRANHDVIHDRFLESAGSSAIARVRTEHNFVWKRGDGFLHGKGATPAWSDSEGRPLLGLIPLNMAAPILLVAGRDNKKYLSFAPHGAGRNRSRRKIRRDFVTRGEWDEDKAKRVTAENVKGIEARWFSGHPDVSELPLGYKDANSIREALDRYNLATVIAEIEPLGSLMAGWNPRREDLEILTPKQERQIEHRAERRRTRSRLRQNDPSFFEDE